MALESINKVTLTGLVVDIIVRTATNKNGQEYIAGRVILETAPDNLIPVEFYQNKMTKNNTPNSVYKGLVTMIEEFKTIARDGRDAADLVSIDSAQLGENSFYSQTGALIREFKVSSPFYNRKANAELQNQYIVSGVVLNLVDEIKLDVPTGKLLIDLLLIGYKNRGDVIKLVVEDEKGVSYMKNSLSMGDEAKFAGQIIIAETRNEKIEEAAFGDPIIQYDVRTEKKLIVTSATPAKASAIPSDELETILADREGRLAKAKADTEKKNNDTSKVSNAASKRNFSL